MKKLDSPKPAVPEGSRNRPAILYVEDEDANWRLAMKALAEHYELTRARNSTEAFELIKARSFRAILMDIQLRDSELDGTEIVRVLRGNAMAKRTLASLGIRVDAIPPIIFVTAYAARYTTEDLITIGGDDVIHKPVDLWQLHLAITRCIAAAATSALNRARSRTPS
jgi:CheY-like chemotaxis protein